MATHLASEHILLKSCHSCYLIYVWLRPQILEMRSLSGGSLAREALMHYTRAIELGFRGSRETAHLFEE
jgi:hypothetical protein